MLRVLFMKRKRKIKIIFLLILASLLIFACVTAVKIEKNYPVAAKQYCDNLVVNEMSKILNSAIIESAENIDTENILLIEKSEDGSVAYISVDTEKVNLIKGKMTLDIIRAIEANDESVFGIPLGNLLGNHSLSGYGPKLPVKIIPVGNVLSKTKSSFVSGGVNQTKYELYIEFIICVDILVPFNKETREIKGELCIAEAVIVGKAPSILWRGDE